MLSRLRQSTPRKHRWTPFHLASQSSRRRVGAEMLGAAELTPGASSFPLHVHHASDELIVVLSGAPTRRDEPRQARAVATLQGSDPVAPSAGLLEQELEPRSIVVPQDPLDHAAQGFDALIADAECDD